MNSVLRNIQGSKPDRLCGVCLTPIGYLGKVKADIKSLDYGFYEREQTNTSVCKQDSMDSFMLGGFKRFILPMGDVVITEQNIIKSLVRLQKIEELPANWNDNGAPRFGSATIKKCRNILSALPVQPEIFPTASDSVQMEYEKENGEYLEFNIFQDRINIFSIDVENEKEYVIGAEEYERLAEIVKEFYARN